MFLALLIYGINGDNREWMPRPEFNVYSWGYWFELAACFFLLNASKPNPLRPKFIIFKFKFKFIFKQSCFYSSRKLCMQFTKRIVKSKNNTRWRCQ